jgi:hypothetical protein
MQLSVKLERIECEYSQSQWRDQFANYPSGSPILCAQQDAPKKWKSQRRNRLRPTRHRGDLAYPRRFLEARTCGKTAFNPSQAGALLSAVRGAHADPSVAHLLIVDLRIVDHDVKA